MAGQKIDGLTARQRKAATLLGLGKSAIKVAKELNTHEGTLCRWRKIPEFIALRDKVCEDNLADMYPEALNVFVDHMRSDDPKHVWLKQQAADRLVNLVRSASDKPQQFSVTFTDAPDVGEAGESVPKHEVEI